MIDAYEIGIQLALQDGVSAGLEAIGRDLAEVDRAIAATTAGLQGLTLAAQTALREAAVGGVRLGAEAGRSTGTAEASSEAAAPQREASGVSPQETVPEAQRIAVPISNVPQSPSAPAGSMRAPPEAADTKAALPEAPVAVEVSPASLSAAPVMAVQQQISVAQAGAAAVAAVPTAPMAAQPSAAPVRPGDDGSAAALVPAVLPRQESASPAQAGGTHRVITASVSKALADRWAAAPESSAVPSTDDYRNATAARPADRAVAAAWVGSPRQERAATQVDRGERATAPQPQAREGGEGISGTVMLDGRMVGYWMSDQMAKEASKPPGGTTFFDPRQSPAWNASGAL